MKKYVPYFILPVLIVFMSRNNPFFWDSTYYSRIGLWFYEHGFKSLILPADLDAGHPPFFGVYLALVWKALGKNLMASHFAILPFAIGINWQLFRLARKFVESRYREICLLVIAFEPTLLAQTSMVSNDLVLVFFYLLGLNSIIKKQPLFLFLAMLGMSMVSTRGIIASGALLLSELLIGYSIEKKSIFTLQNLKSIALPYLGAGIIISSWLWYHYSQAGWLLTPASGNWSGQREIIGIGGMLRNVGIIAWRLMDFGRLGLWIITLLCVPMVLRKKLYLNPNFKTLLITFLAPLIIFSLAFIPFSNPIGHRYYLVVYLLFGILASYIFMHCLDGWKRTSASVFVIAMLLGGHFWIYPDTIAKGWDSTLAHFPYFNLRSTMVKKMDDYHIAINQTGSDFPNTFPDKVTMLTEDTTCFLPKDLSKNKFILQSNIMNGFTDAELKELKSDKWYMLLEYKKAGVYMRLYGKKM